MQQKGLRALFFCPPGRFSRGWPACIRAEYLPHNAIAWVKQVKDALYDLANVDVLRGPGYAKIAGSNYSRWTERIVARVWGQYRAEGVQISPGGGMLGGAGTCSRLVVWRFRRIEPGLRQQLTDGFLALHEGQAEIAQVRLFEANFAAGTDIIGIVEQHAPWTPPSGSVRGLGAGL